MAFRFARHVLAVAGWPAAATPPSPDSLEMDPNDPVFRAVAGFSHPGLLTVERQWDPKRKVWQSVLNVEAVRSILREIDLGETPELLVWNKSDRLPEQEAKALADRTGGIAVSALNGEGLGELLRKAEELLWREDHPENHRLSFAQELVGGTE